MKRLDSYVGSIEAAFQQRPEVLDSVGVDLPVNIGLQVIHDLMSKLLFKALVSGVLVGIDLGTAEDFIENLCLQSLALSVGHNSSTHLAKFAIKHSHNHGFVHVLVWVANGAIDGIQLES